MYTPQPGHIEVRDMTIAYADFVIQRNLNFSIYQGEVFIIMGGSGCGKTSVMRHMIGLKRPVAGDVLYSGESFWGLDEADREVTKRCFGVMFQAGALWSSLTLHENIALPLQEYTLLSAREIRQLALLKLALVGLKGFEDYYPSQISGGMRKRVGVARAMALDPQVLFFDEPGAGLDPVSANLLDRLILELRDSFGTTMVVVTHELASIFAIGDNSVFLDPVTKTAIAAGNPRQLLEDCDDPRVIRFLTRGQSAGSGREAEVSR